MNEMYGYQPMYRQQIVQVNGQNGAQMFRMAPNCSALLLDENKPIVWFVQTDGAGYKTLVPYKIELYVPEPEPDVNSLLERIKVLEGKLNESNSAKPPKRQSGGRQAAESGGADVSGVQIDA